MTHCFDCEHLKEEKLALASGWVKCEEELTAEIGRLRSENDALRVKLLSEFPVYENPDSIDENTRPIEWVMMTERKRLHDIINAMYRPAAPEQEQVT